MNFLTALKFSLMRKIALISDSYIQKVKGCDPVYIFQWLAGFIFFALSLSQATASHPAKEQVSTWYDEILLSRSNDSLLMDLLQSKPVQRLKHINQYGVIQLVDSAGHNNESYTRFDHSLGVFYLLRRFGAPLREQVSGLLHDVSHSAFSHVSDYLYSEASDGDPNYHDSLFIVFLEKHEIAGILNQYRLSPVDVEPKHADFTRLERELPDLCADRIDYILQGAGRRGDLNRTEVDYIIGSLRYDVATSHWYINNQEAARLLAEASLELNKNIFVTGWGRVLYRWTAEAVKQLIAIGELTQEDFSYRMSDIEVWNKLSASKDSHVRELMKQMQSVWYNIYEVDNAVQADITFENLRCRVVDPRVLTPDGWTRLSSLDPVFKKSYAAEMKRCRRLYVLIKSPKS